jgi:universal stress protein F
MMKRILVPHDERSTDETIVTLVGAVARETGATVRLLRVFPVPRNVVAPGGRTVAYVDQEMARLSQQGLAELEAAAAIGLEGVAVETAARFGDPAEEILAEAEAFGADLIALGATARGRIRKLLGLGVTDEVTRKATVPTLVFNR